MKGLRTVKCVYLHVFFIQIAARQQNQVQEHKALYHSINSYSEEIAGTVKDLSPLGVLKTAILLHQRQPREGTNDPTMQKACSAPAIQAKMNTLSPAQLQFEEKKSVALRIRSQAGFPPYQGKWKYERSCSTDIRLGHKGRR